MAPTRPSIVHLIVYSRHFSKDATGRKRFDILSMRQDVTAFEMNCITREGRYLPSHKVEERERNQLS